MENENNEPAQANRFRAIVFRVVNYAQKHIFFVNFLVLNAVCLVAVQSTLQDRSTAEVIAIYNAVFVACALLSQFFTRGYFARDHETRRRRRQPADTQSGVFEEEDDEGAGNVELPIPEVLNDPANVILHQENPAYAENDVNENEGNIRPNGLN